MSQQTIPCPNCGNNILFDTYALIQGAGFACNTCHAKISLAGESKATVQQTMEQLEDLKKNVLSKKQDD